MACYYSLYIKVIRNEYNFMFQIIVFSIIQISKISSSQVGIDHCYVNITIS